MTRRLIGEVGQQLLNLDALPPLPDPVPTVTHTYASTDTVRVKIQAGEAIDYAISFGPDGNGNMRTDVGPGVRVVADDGETIYEPTAYGYPGAYKIVTVDLTGVAELVTTVVAADRYDVVSAGTLTADTVSFVSAAGGVASARSVALSQLSGVVDGDTLIAAYYTPDGAPSVHTDPPGWTRILESEVTRSGAGSGGGDAAVEAGTQEVEANVTTITVTLPRTPLGSERTVVSLVLSQPPNNLQWTVDTAGAWTVDEARYRSNGGGSHAMVFSLDGFTGTSVTLSTNQSAPADVIAQGYILTDTQAAAATATDAGYGGNATSPVTLTLDTAQTGSVITIGAIANVGTISSATTDDPEVTLVQTVNGVTARGDHSNGVNDVTIELSNNRQYAAVLVAYPATAGGASDAVRSVTAWAKEHDGSALSDLVISSTAETTDAAMACAAYRGLDPTDYTFSSNPGNLDQSGFVTFGGGKDTETGAYIMVSGSTVSGALSYGQASGTTMAARQSGGRILLGDHITNDNVDRDTRVEYGSTTDIVQERVWIRGRTTAPGGGGGGPLPDTLWVTDWGQVDLGQYNTTKNNTVFPYREGNVDGMVGSTRPGDQDRSLLEYDAEIDEVVLRSEFPPGQVGFQRLGTTWRYYWGPGGHDEPANNVDEIWLVRKFKLSANWLYSVGPDDPPLSGRLVGGKMGMGTYGGDQKIAGGAGGPGTLGTSTRLGFDDINGALSVYVYHADQPGEYGDHFLCVVDNDGNPVTSTPGNLRPNGTRYVLPTDQWVEIVMGHKLNTPGQNDGEIDVYVDGQQVGRMRNIKFRNAGITWGFNRIGEAHFFGGKDASYGTHPAPHTTQYSWRGPMTAYVSSPIDALYGGGGGGGGGGGLTRPWTVLGPGGGGFRTEISHDPSRPGVMGSGDDNGGAWVSFNDGVDWEYAGFNLQQVTTHRMCWVPSGRLYVGTGWGLGVSDDDGYTYTFPDILDRLPVSVIEPSPFNPDRVIFGVGTNFRGNTTNQMGADQPAGTGPKVVYYTLDGGDTIQSSTVAGGTWTRQTSDAVWVSSTQVLIGTVDGIYRGTLSGGNFTWEGPWKPTGKGACRGLAITGDRKGLIACWQDQAGWVKSNATATVYGHNAANPSQSYNLGINGENWWHPRVDPRNAGRTTWDQTGSGSASPLRFVLPAADKGAWDFNEYEVTFTGDWPGASGTPTVTPTLILGPSNQGQFSRGWDTIPAVSNVFEAAYRPREWGSARRVDFVQAHTIHTADATNPTGTESNLSSITVGNEGGETTYRNRGVTNITHTDIDGLGDYIVMAQADNCVTESFTEGDTWGHDRPNKPGDATKAMAYGEFCRIVPLSPPLVLLGSAQGYGNPTPNAGWLFGKRLTSYDFGPAWKVIAGGLSTTRAGIVGVRIYDGDYNPSDPSEVVVVTDAGIYITSDILGVFNGTASFSKLSQYGSTRHTQVRWHATNTNRFYVSGGGGLIRMTRSGGSWSGTVISTMANQPIDTWSNGGVDYLVQSGPDVRLSIDDGPLNVVLTNAEWDGLGQWDWIPEVAPEFDGGTPDGVAGGGNKIYVVGSRNEIRKPYMLARGTISGSSVTWESWMGTPAARGQVGRESSWLFAPRADRLRVGALTSGDHLLVPGRGHAGFMRAT